MRTTITPAMTPPITAPLTPPPASPTPASVVDIVGVGIGAFVVGLTITGGRVEGELEEEGV